MPSQAEIIAKERQDLMNLLDSIPRQEVDENILIATWNIAQFSNKKRRGLSSTLPTSASSSTLSPSRKSRPTCAASPASRSSSREIARSRFRTPGHRNLVFSAQAPNDSSICTISTHGRENTRHESWESGKMAFWEFNLPMK